MARDPRYDILFQPLRIGPVTIKNRFYQVPHCTGMGWARPESLAAMREVKAEGGWGAVCTEYASIHPSSDDAPYPYASLWDDRDVRASALMCERVHAHGALAGAELWHGGARSANNLSREVPMDVDSLPNLNGQPLQTRAMDKQDIADLRRWHRKAALRARAAGFDIVYVYATHGYLLDHFLNPAVNTRGDEYGGSLENRTRLVRELIEETKEAVGDRCAVAVRFSADETPGIDGQPDFGERRELFETMAEMPDLWDINIADYDLEMGASRFVREGALEPYLTFVKSVTSKPVVSVGRFTSPDTMASQLKRGVLDLIGAARPSIADPFLPKKIEEGRADEIRECIGCNICYAHDTLGVPIRCTQNPTMGEEWRKGWHPEWIAPKRRDARVLIVGAGPAGLEAARALGQRGYDVMLAEASRTLGGRLPREAALPGMSEYIRVRDYREHQLSKMTNVQVFRESRLTAQDVADTEPDHVVVATGARWRNERFDGNRYVAVADSAVDAQVFTPDDIMDGRLPEGPTLLYDSDRYYMGATLAGKLRSAGIPVTFATPSDSVAPWARHTAEQRRMRQELHGPGVEVVPSKILQRFDGQSATLACAYSGRETQIPSEAILMVTARRPSDGLYHELLATAGREGLSFSLIRIGDCEAPATVAAAIYAGHRFARELDAPVNRDNPVRHERTLTQSPAPDRTDYLDTLLLYYEEEIMGDAYFRSLAERFDGERHGKMIRMADVEICAADAVRPLIDNYGLTPRPIAELEAIGRRDAADEPGDWDGLIEKMRGSFPAYIDAFERLERMAPAEDRAALQRLTEHEHAAIRFLEREHAGDPASAAPLEEYIDLCSPGSSR